MRWPMQEKSLYEVNSELLHRLELLGALDAFGDHLGSMVVGEIHHRRDQILFDEIRIDRVDERHVELDEVRLEVGDRSQPGVATSRVVDGEAEATFAEETQALAELRIVL